MLINEKSVLEDLLVSSCFCRTSLNWFEGGVGVSYRFNRKNIVVRLLEHARGISNETETIDRRVQRVVIHSRYDYTTFNNDIALLSLDRDVALEGRLRPACLPALGRSFAGMQGVVIGWGTTEQYGGSSDVLNEVKVPIMSNKECRMTPYGDKAITENMMCAGFPEGKKDACQGDSGGPLHVTNGTLYSVAGVVSWGEGCALPNHPGVYTRVNRYVSWIKRNTIDSCFCE